MPCHYCGASAPGTVPIIEMTGHVRPGCCAAAPRAAPGCGLPPGYAPVSPRRGVALFAAELAGSGTAAILAARGAGPVTMLGAPSDAGRGQGTAQRSGAEPPAAAAAADMGQVVDVFRYGSRDPVAVSVSVEG